MEGGQRCPACKASVMQFCGRVSAQVRLGMIEREGARHAHLPACTHHPPPRPTHPRAGVKRLARLGMIEKAPGMGALDMNTAEDHVVDRTREVVDGMVSLTCSLGFC